MSLADRLAGAVSTSSPHTGCEAGRLLAQLVDDDPPQCLAALEAMHDPYLSDRTLAEALRLEGLLPPSGEPVSSSSLGRHRRAECQCRRLGYPMGPDDERLADL